MSKAIARAVQRCVELLQAAVRDEVAGALGRPKRPRDMRCVHKDARGRRCESRSKGPRFAYLCARHVDARIAVAAAKEGAA